MGLFSESINTCCSTFYFTIFVVILISYIPLLNANNNESDRIALLEIKAKMIHDHQDALSSWNDTTPFCNWLGVACSVRHHRVTALDLSSSNLTGSISPFIGNLSFLRSLHLEHNAISGSIPPEIGRLRRLQYICLTNNSIEGEIPSNISGCSHLHYLFLFGNSLVGRIPPELGLLSRLQYLSMPLNSLTGTIPSFLGNLTSLSYLSLTANSLVERIPDNLGNLKRLTFLSLGENNLTGMVPSSIFNLSLLNAIELGKNHGLGGTLPNNIGNQLPQLSYISLANNQFTGAIPDSISNLSKLEVLEFAANKFGGQVPSLHNLQLLWHLDLEGNMLGYGLEHTDLSFLSTLGNASMLHRLILDGNYFKGVFPTSICNFSLLVDVLLDYNFFVGEIPSHCLENLANLQLFSASWNELSGEIPPGLGKLKKLNHLRLDSNYLSGYIPSTLGNLSLLTVLSLSDNSLQGPIPSSLGGCISLIQLDFSQNRLNGSIPTQPLGLSTLSVGLNLSGNLLTGPLPKEVGALRNLEALDVSANRLSGTIPAALGSCIALEKLYMRRNLLQGPIPDALMTLKGLEWLDLSRNNLSGTIPVFLSSLPLQMLNLSYNADLEGEVPVGGIFSNVHGFLVMGNARLCGGTSGLKLPKCRMGRPRNNKRIILAMALGIVGCVSIVAFVFLTLWYKRRTKEPFDGTELKSLEKISYTTLLKATNGFSSDNNIGSGNFGVVYKGFLDPPVGAVAIKVFKLENRASKSFMAECEVLRNIRHRNLVKVITACSSADYQGNDFKALVFEYMANGSLDNWLHHAEQTDNNEGTSNAPENLNLFQRLDIAVDIALALEYLHYQCGTTVVHCDLKPSNVLLDEDMVAHVGDFGLAKLLSSSRANQSSSIGVGGTIGYTPPEYGLGNEASTSGDIYSFGIFLLEMFTGKRPSHDMFRDDIGLHEYVKDALHEHTLDIIDNALHTDVNTEETIDALASILDIGLSCSVESPRQRLDIRDVVATLRSTQTQLLKYSSTLKKHFTCERTSRADGGFKLLSNPKICKI